MKRQFVLFGLLLMVLLPAVAPAQEVASLTGIVTDPSGAVVMDGNVTDQTPGEIAGSKDIVGWY